MNSFPEKNIKEIIKIEKAYYHHLCDLFIETFKLIHMSNKETMERMQMTNPELLNRLYNEGKDVVAILGHFGNWEWLVCRFIRSFRLFQYINLLKTSILTDL